jgi:hypothetical protein
VSEPTLRTEEHREVLQPNGRRIWLFVLLIVQTNEKGWLSDAILCNTVQIETGYLQRRQ